MARRWIFIILTVLWMGFIFWQSHAPATSSAEESGVVVRVVENVFFPQWKHMDPDAQTAKASQLSYLVRKSAHFLEFLVLGLFFGAFVASFPSGGYPVKIAVSCAFGILYGCLDEFHQYFVEGRSMEFFDMTIDAAGAVFGSLLSIGIMAMALHAALKKKTADTPM